MLLDSRKIGLSGPGRAVPHGGHIIFPGENDRPGIVLTWRDIGEPFDIDNEACQMAGVKSEYLDLVKVARIGFEA